MKYLIIERQLFTFQFRKFNYSKVLSRIALIFLLLDYTFVHSQNVGINDTDPLATLDINGDLRLRSFDLNLIGTDQHDLDLTTHRYSVYTFNSATVQGTIITGMTGGVDGREILFFNSSADPISFFSDAHAQSISSDAQNRILNPPSQNISVAPNGTITFRYDGGKMRWTPVSGINTEGLNNQSTTWNILNTHISNANSGNVGIGTSSPDTKLHIEGTSIIANNDFIDPDLFPHKVVAGRIADGTGWESIGLGGKNGNPGQAWAIGSVNGDFSIAASNGASDNSLQTGLILDVQRNLLLTPFGGKVGIGANIPAEKLHVDNGNVKIGKNAIWQGPQDSKYLYFGDGNYVSIGEVGGDDNMEVKGSSIKLLVNGSGSVTIPNGNLGIGTSNPSHLLSVNGVIRSKEILVEAIPWPDYVFSPQYNLPNLKEVEKYIQENQHLPNIPKAKDIEEQGQAVGEIQRKMMEKIEELTLYIIILNKKIENLENSKK